MTCINATSDGRSFELEVMGHSGYAPKGEDIVCAGVSTLVQTLLVSVEGIHKIKNGYVYISATGDKEIELFKFVITGLRMLEEAYPNHIRLDERGWTIFP